MRQIPLNFQTLHADLAQSVSLQGDELPVGPISTRTVKGNAYLYVTVKDGASRRQISLGRADDGSVQARAERIAAANARYKSRRTTVSTLKQKARLPAPSLPLGRVLESVSNAGLFRSGVILVGTVAFQTYAPIIGYHLPSAALMTNDADLLVASLISKEQISIGDVLKRADPTFSPHINPDEQLPSLFRAASGLQVDILTSFKRERRSPVAVPELGCAAEALRFMEYLAEESLETVALYGAGVAVRVPPPIRYAVHKLLVAQQRPLQFAAKRRKDLVQARELLGIFLQTDADELETTLDDARARGRKWSGAINKSLIEIGWIAQRSGPPLPPKE